MRHFTFASTLAAVALLFFSAWLAIEALNEFDQSDTLWEELRGIQGHSDRLLWTLKDAEPGQRGFVITQNPAYLAPYEDAKARLTADLAALRAEPRLANETLLLESIDTLAAAKMEVIAQTIALAKAGRQQAALDLVQSSQGQEIMTRLRSKIDELNAKVADELAHHRNLARSVWLKAAIVGLGIVASALLLLAAAYARHRAQAAIEASQAALERFKHAFGASHGLMRGIDGRITFWGDGMQALYGYSAEEAVGRVSHELLCTRFPIPLTQLEAILVEKGNWEGELVHCHRDGSALVVASHWVLHRGGSDEPDIVIESNNDISGTRHAHRELERSNALLRTIIDTAPGVIYAKDRGGRLILANKGTLELLGKPWAEIQGRTDLEVLNNPEQAEIVMANDRRVMELGQAQEVEEVDEGAKLRVWLSTKTPLRDFDGQVCGLVGVSIDITERQQRNAELVLLNAELRQALAERRSTQEALEKSEQEFRASFEAAAVGKAHIEPLSGRIIRANGAFAHMLGYQPEELAGSLFWDFTWPADLDGEMDEYANALAGDFDSYVCERRCLTRAGQPIWARVSATIVRLATTHKPTLFIAIIENIDERYKAELALAETKKELEQTVVERTSALRQRDLLIREVYHRVKNNMQIVDGILVMQLRQLLDPSSKTAITSLRGRVQALGLVHHQLMGSANLSTFDIARFLDELVVNLTDAHAQSGVEIIVRAPPIDVGLDFAVPLGLLVTELVTNSLKHAFSDGKGTIDIVLDRRADGSMDLVVSDNGKGYDSTVGVRKLGLGTSIVKGLVHQLGGTFSVTSASGTRTDIHLAQPRLS